MSFAKFEGWDVIDGYAENSILGFLIESDEVRDMANYAKNFGCSVEGKGKGATAMKEGPVANKFIGAMTEAKKAGKDSFEVNGKTYKVKK